MEAARVKGVDLEPGEMIVCLTPDSKREERSDKLQVNDSFIILVKLIQRIHQRHEFQ